MTSDEKRKVCGADVVGGWRMYCHDLYGRSATDITVVLVGTGVVNIDNAGDFHDGPVHRCMQRDIVRVFFRGEIVSRCRIYRHSTGFMQQIRMIIF